LGIIAFKDGQADVLDVQKAPHKQPLHTVRIAYGELRVGDPVRLAIDVPRRQRTMANHSSAHLVQSALKTVLGSHIQQAGSFVAPDYMRFDFTHYEKVSDEQLKTIEALVNRYIFEKHPVRFDLMKLDEAKASGATALFSEKYEANVRVVTMGSVSKELCGGTHVNNTQEIGVFKIASEESIGSGIRRLTTKTQSDAYADFVGYKEQLEAIAALFKATRSTPLKPALNMPLKKGMNCGPMLPRLSSSWRLWRRVD
jgi:alanyl-tRNA synthetase